MILELFAAASMMASPQDVQAGPLQRLDSVKVGFVLSGGSAKAFAHIGVIEVLEEAGIQADIVSGTSMGSLIGGLYAIGYSTQMLDSLVRSLDWRTLFSDDVARRDIPMLSKKFADANLITLPIRDHRPALPAGLINGQRISELLTRLTWSVHSLHDFAEFPIPFVAVATDIENGDAVPISSGFLPDALRASIALPGVFLPVKIDGRLLVDGGIARNLPAQDAQALGADVLVCSDVSAPLATADSIRSLIDVFNQTISFRSEESNRLQRELCDVLIRPDITGLSSRQFDEAEEWIERGRRAATEALAAIRSLVGTRTGRGRVSHSSPAIDSVFVAGVELEGAVKSSPSVVRRTLNLRMPGWLSPGDIRDAIARLYGTGLFVTVRYRLDSTQREESASVKLIVILEEGRRDDIAFSYRYDSQYQASLLLSASLTDLLRFGSTLKFRIRLGSQVQLGAYFYRVADLVPPLSLAARIEFDRTPIDIFQDGRRVATAETDAFDLSLFAGVGLGNSAAFGARFKAEYAETESAVAGEGFEEDDLFYTIAGMLAADSRDQVRFPMRGVWFVGKSEWADRSIGSGLTFSQQMVNANFYIPTAPWLTVHVGGVLGVSNGDDLPFHYEFVMGGANQYFLFDDRQFPFYGLSVQERRGPYLQILRAALFFQPVSDLFLQAAWNSGNTFDEWTVDFGSYIHGYGVTSGVVTPFGQLRLTLSETELDRLPRVEIDIGYSF